MSRHRAVTAPVRFKPTLMRPHRLWKHAIYPLWLRWYKWRLDSRLWKAGGYDLGDVVYWRGVRLVCCRRHFCGDAADHPWDPGAGWHAEEAATLWEPARRRDRLLMRIVGFRTPWRVYAPRFRREAESA